MDPKKELSKISKMSAHELDLELKKYETQRWKESRGTKIEFNLNIKNKYKKVAMREFYMNGKNYFKLIFI